MEHQRNSVRASSLVSPPFPVTGASVSPPALSGHYPVFPLFKRRCWPAPCMQVRRSSCFIRFGRPGAEIASVVLSILLVNLRYLLMSSAISIFFRPYTVLQKIISGLLLTDETFGVAIQHGGGKNIITYPWMLGLNLTAWLNWILACVSGAHISLSASIIVDGRIEL